MYIAQALVGVQRGDTPQAFVEKVFILAPELPQVHQHRFKPGRLGTMFDVVNSRLDVEERVDSIVTFYVALPYERVEGVGDAAKLLAVALLADNCPLRRRIARIRLIDYQTRKCPRQYRLLKVLRCGKKRFREWGWP